MSEVATSRTQSTRSLAWTFLAAVPALGILALGSGVLTGELSGSASPPPSIADIREFNRLGDDLAGVTDVKAEPTSDAALDQWQNTVRRRPSPRR
jgi:hypothetical protein